MVSGRYRDTSVGGALYCRYSNNDTATRYLTNWLYYFATCGVFRGLNHTTSYRTIIQHPNPLRFFVQVWITH